MTARNRRLATVAVIATVAVLLVAAWWYQGQASGEPAARREVIIYYANETAPDAVEAVNFDTICEWLRGGDHANHVLVADQLTHDREMFPAAVDVEVGALASELPHLTAGPEAVVFTNRIVRQGKCKVWKRGWKSFREEAFPTPADENSILTSNPLSRLTTFQDALAFAAQQFDPREHDFILITKSHGSEKKAITPRLVVRAEETNREELLQVAAGMPAHAVLPAWAGRLGIAKSDYFETLRDTGSRLGMRYSLVYLEACKALTRDILPERVPDNIERVLIIAEHANYNNLLYADLLQGMRATDRFSQVVCAALPPKFVSSSKSASHRFSSISLVYCIPLALALTWAAVEWRRSRGSRSLGSANSPPESG